MAEPDTIEMKEMGNEPGTIHAKEASQAPETIQMKEMSNGPGTASQARQGELIIAEPRKADNTCITFAANIGIVILMIINIASLLLGIGLIIVGAYVKKELDKHEDIMELLDLIDLGTFTLKSLIYTLIGVIIACGVFGIITSLIGGVGAFFGLRVLLIIYVIILVLVIILELLILSLWIDLLNKTNEQLKGLFEDLLREYTGFNDITVYTVGWDLIFIFFNCCGVSPVTSQYNDFAALPTVWWPSRGNDVIPFSCCESANYKTYLQQNDTACTEHRQNYHTNGCYDAFDEIFTKLASAAISITTILLLIEITAIFFSILIVIAVSLGRKVGLLDQYKKA